MTRRIVITMTETVVTSYVVDDEWLTRRGLPTDLDTLNSSHVDEELFAAIDDIDPSSHAAKIAVTEREFVITDESPCQQCEQIDCQLTLDGPMRPANWWHCSDCNAHVERYRGQGDVQCPECGASYNAGGQRLRDDWSGNPSNYDDEISDLEGFESQYAGD